MSRNNNRSRKNCSSTTKPQANRSDAGLEENNVAQNMGGNDAYVKTNIIQPKTNNKGYQDSISLDLSNNDIGKDEPTLGGVPCSKINNFSFTQKNKILETNHAMLQKEKDAGVIGKYIGANTKNAAINIAFILVVVIGIILFLDAMAAVFCPNRYLHTEMWSKLVPVLATALGYIFGRGFE